MTGKAISSDSASLLRRPPFCSRDTHDQHLRTLESIFGPAARAAGSFRSPALKQKRIEISGADGWSRYSKVPRSLTSRAAPSNPVMAARYSEVARLMRFTPAAESSAT